MGTFFSNFAATKRSYGPKNPETPQKWRHFEDQYTPAIEVQTPPLEGP